MAREMGTILGLPLTIQGGRGEDVRSLRIPMSRKLKSHVSKELQEDLK